MNVSNMTVQRIFIYMNQQPATAQVKDLQNLGLTLYLDSWIPPVGSFNTGYLLADMPVDKLAALTRKDYVISLDTAERQFQPQNGAQPQ